MYWARSIFAIIVALLLGIALAVPLEDSPQTPYDESEAIPYECTPNLSTIVAGQYESASKRLPFSQPASVLKPPLGFARQAVWAKFTSSLIPVPLHILDHVLRC